MSGIFDAFYLIGYMLAFVAAWTLLLYMIDWISPDDIIKKTLDHSRNLMNLYPYFSKSFLILGAIFTIFGIIIVIVDNFLLINGEPRGYSLVSFGLIYFSISFTTIQTYGNYNDNEKIQKKLGLDKITPKIIREREIFQKILYFSRFLFIVGCGICLIGGISLSLEAHSNLSIILGRIELIGVGFTVIITASAFEVEIVDRINREMVLNKLIT